MLWGEEKVTSGVYPRINSWTKQEIRILRENYADHTMEELLKLLPNRSRDSIRKKRKILKLYKNKWWTEKETSLLKRNMSASKEELLRLFPNRKMGLISDKLRYLGYSRRKVMIMKRFNHKFPLTNEELAYMAGIVDGEGTLAIRGKGNSYCPEFRITNTDKSLIDWLNIRVHFSSMHLRKREINRRPCWDCLIRGFKMYNLLKSLLPYLIIKRKHAELLIKFIESRVNGAPIARRYNDYEISLRNRVKELNAHREVTA